MLEIKIINPAFKNCSRFNVDSFDMAIHHFCNAVASRFECWIFVSGRDVMYSSGN